MEGLSQELDFALKSHDPYPINLESLVDLLKYKHISSLTTHLKRHFQRDIDYKKFHQVRNKRQICVYYISVDCFKQICGYCRHTQRKEIAQNLLGNLNDNANNAQIDASGIAQDVDNLSFTDLLNDMSDLKGESDEDEDDVKMRQSSPPSKSIKIERPTGQFAARDHNPNVFKYNSRSENKITIIRDPIHPHNSSDAIPNFSSNVYNFNNLAAATAPITPHAITPITSKSTSTLTTSLAANALANAAIANTQKTAPSTSSFHAPFDFSLSLAPSAPSPFSAASFASVPPPFSSPSASNPTISSFSSNSFNTSCPVTNINTITPINTTPSNPIPISSPFATPSTTNSHKRSSSSRSTSSYSLNNNLQNYNSHIPVTQPTPIITPTTPITPTPALTAVAPFSSTPASTTSPSSAIPFTPAPTVPTPAKVSAPITPILSHPAPTSPTMSKTAPAPATPSKKTFFGFGNLGSNLGSTSKNGSFLNSYKPAETEFKADPEAATLFDFGLGTQSADLQFYDDYLTLSSSPTSMFDPVNTLAEVDKIYEQWELERGPKMNSDWP